MIGVDHNTESWQRYREGLGRATAAAADTTPVAMTAEELPSVVQQPEDTEQMHSEFYDWQTAKDHFTSFASDKVESLGAVGLAQTGKPQ